MVPDMVLDLRLDLGMDLGMDKLGLSLERHLRRRHRRRRDGLALVPRPATDHIALERDGAVAVVQLVVQSTGIAQDLTRVVLAPQGGQRGLAVGADRGHR